MDYAPLNGSHKLCCLWSVSLTCCWLSEGKSTLTIGSSDVLERMPQGDLEKWPSPNWTRRPSTVIKKISRISMSPQCHVKAKITVLLPAFPRVSEKNWISGPFFSSPWGMLHSANMPHSALPSKKSSNPNCYLDGQAKKIFKQLNWRELFRSNDISWWKTIMKLVLLISANCSCPKNRIYVKKTRVTKPRHSQKQSTNVNIWQHNQGKSSSKLWPPPLTFYQSLYRTAFENQLCSRDSHMTYNNE